ncbi:S1C family serine protease [Cellulomonas sp. SG140]|uniref:S1C family serine protease n=1 Tax=Cellulomonas sp. SG140 TaxID=2976536 RepID=UPI0021E96094|nr:trypsin-like peptidase domain-containing protein [Cellulomonas sp. SG140]
MTTTDSPGPDGTDRPEGAQQPPADQGPQGTADAGEEPTAQPEHPQAADTQALPVEHPTQPLPTSAQPPTAPTAQQPTASQAPVPPQAGHSYPIRSYGTPYPGQPGQQPYGGPAQPGQQPYPPVAGRPYAQPYGAQPYPGQAPGQPYGGQSYPGQSYPGQAYPGQTYPGQPYPSQGTGQPYAGFDPYAGPGQPTGTAEAAEVDPNAPRGSAARRRWLPLVATLVVVLLLAIGAVAVASRGGSRSTAGGSHPASLATIGHSGSSSVPVSGSSSQNPNWPAVVQAVHSSVVAISVTTASGQAEGSGVIIDSKAHVLTNDHVVSGAQNNTVQVTLDDGRLFEATIVGTDPTTDLAVVQLKNAPNDLTVAQFGDSDKVAVGQAVMAVGNPLGLANTVTTGIVSAVDRPVSTSESGGQPVVTNAIQIDAAINPGNSGGPLFDAQGQVIGITSSIATTSSQSGSIGLGFAIPVNLMKNIAAQLIDSGSAKHAFLGVSLKDGTATADGVTRRGAAVQSVSSGSPAANAGIQNGDVIVAIDNNPTGGAESLTAFVRAMTSGQQATLTVVRNGKAMDVKVTLATKQETATQNGSGSGSNGSNGSNRSNGSTAPGNLSPEQLWQWLQQQGGGTGGSSPNQG